MIEKKEINLRVVEGGKRVKKPLAQVDLTGKKEHAINTRTYHAYYELLNKYFNEAYFKNYFVNEYLTAVNNIKNLFQEVAARSGRKINLLEKIVELDIIYADEPSFPHPAGYAKDAEDGNLKQNPPFYFDETEGMVIALERKHLQTHCYYAMAHECGGHYLDFLFNRKRYRRRTATMNEAMALLTEKHLGTKGFYTTSPLHLRAERLLRALSKTSFNKMGFADQWQLLNNLLDHQKAQEYFKEHLEEKPEIKF